MAPVAGSGPKCESSLAVAGHYPPVRDVSGFGHRPPKFSFHGNFSGSPISDLGGHGRAAPLLLPACQGFILKNTTKTFRNANASAEL